MSHEFLRSSPARDDSFDSKPNRTSSIVKTPATNKVTSTPFKKSLMQSAKKAHALHSQQQQQAPSLSIPPSASKLTNQLTNLTGWTPLISKTYSNEQIISFNSTPNKLFISSSLSQAQIQPQLLHPQQPTQSQSQAPQSANTSTNFVPTYNINDYEYQNFGLTPFINHNFNFNLMSSGGGVNTINPMNNITPFNEKIFQQNCDFFIDSPLRTTKDNVDGCNTSLNFENFSITPSKFSLNTVASNRKILQDPLKSATKRNINMVDTPPRVPHKLSIITRAENAGDAKEVIRKQVCQPDDDKDTEDEQDNEEEEDDVKPEMKSPTVVSRIKKQSNQEDKNIQGEAKDLETPQTPCKKESKDMSIESEQDFNTPANKQTRPESPSTILVTSTERLSNLSLDDAFDSKKLTKHNEEEEEEEDEEEDLGEDKDEDDKENQPPPSPTPAKVSNQPKMGIFTEVKSKKVVTKGHSRSRSSFHPTTTTTSFKSGYTLTTTSSGDLASTAKSKDPKKVKAENRARMQAGMNKFQIVLTDVNSISGRKKKLHNNNNNNNNNHNNGKKDEKSKPQIKVEQTQPTLIPLQPPSLHPQSSTLMENHNVTMSSTKENNHNNSSILSHNSMNSSHLNLTTDHSSFEIGGHGSGGFSSTPNSKMLLDKIFEKPSPNHSGLFYPPQQHGPQPPPQHQPSHISQQSGTHVKYPQSIPMPPPPPPHQPPGQFETSGVDSTGKMPPPVSQHPPPTSSQRGAMGAAGAAGAIGATGGPFVQYSVMTMMSTPQHSHIYNVGDLVPNNGPQQPTNSQAPMSVSSASSATNVMQIPSPWNITFGTPSGFSTFFANLPAGQSASTTNMGNDMGVGATNRSSSSASNTAAALAAVAAGTSTVGGSGGVKDNYS
ncbi:hypothetical protein K4G60_g4860 [Candida parapsilosis]|nr:hypothetical protein K4G60_g4860 [Candida parapsilosis]KAI5910655.1 hypothetical protein K4G61_g4355 [Candida parapsilosis]CAD1809745.1 unnamed protein product [Candida parapsilosis]